MIAEDYIPLADKLAWPAVHKWGVDPEEAQSDAYLGVTKAAHARRPGEPFTAYAQTFIWGEIRHGVCGRMGMRGGRSPRRPSMLRLDDPVSDGSDESFADRVPDLDSLSPDEAAWHRELWRMVAQLPERQVRVVYSYYTLDTAQAEIAQAEGVSQMQISRDLAAAYKARLRGFFEYSYCGKR